MDPIKITNHRVTSKGSTNGSGAIHLLSNGKVLLATGDGELYRLSIGESTPEIGARR